MPVKIAALLSLLIVLSGLSYAYGRSWAAGLWGLKCPLLLAVAVPAAPAPTSSSPSRSAFSGRSTSSASASFLGRSLSVPRFLGAGSNFFVRRGFTSPRWGRKLYSRSRLGGWFMGSKMSNVVNLSLGSSVRVTSPRSVAVALAVFRVNNPRARVGAFVVDSGFYTAAVETGLVGLAPAVYNRLLRQARAGFVTRAGNYVSLVPTPAPVTAYLEYLGDVLLGD